MPRADGLEALRGIREHGPTAHTPVIMLTAKSALADKMKGFERGADDYVAKPFEPAEILARVQVLLKRTAQSRVVRPLLSVLGDWFTAEHMAQFGRDLEAARDIQQRLLRTLDYLARTFVGMNHQNHTIRNRCHQHTVSKRRNGWRVDHNVVKSPSELENDIAHLLGTEQLCRVRRRRAGGQQI